MVPIRDIQLLEDPVLSTTEVGELFGVHASTVKRWCDRGDLTFRRTEGGHRRIPLSEVLRRAREDDEELPLLDFEDRAAGVWQATGAARKRNFGPTRRLAADVLADDAPSRLGDLFVHLGRDPDVDLHGLLDEGLRPVMEEVGERWNQGEIGPGVEHVISEVVAGTLHRLRYEGGRRVASRHRPSLALVGAVEGERHALGARCVRLTLERVGWDVAFLGADVPMEAWESIQRDREARMICISFSRCRGPADLLRCARRLAGTYDAERPYVLALGGDARVDGPPEGPWPFTAVRFFPSLRPFAAWLGEPGAGA